MLEVLTLLAILLSPLVAVLVTVWLQNRKEERGRKLWIFNTLIGNRHLPLAEANIRALNLIDIAYHDAQRVRQLWHDYLEMLGNEGLNNPKGWEIRQKKNLEMITAMANHLGYGEAITHLDVDRVYYPIALEKQARRNEEMSDEVMNFLRAVSKTLAEQKQAQSQGAPPPN
jgi:hypothetical protein